MRAVLAVLLGLVVLGVGGWIYTRYGWIPVPPDPPTTSTLHDPRFEETDPSALDLLIAAHRAIGAPAITAAVSIDGIPVWSGAVGWADLQQRVAATPVTRFRIGSTSKALTATALGRLVDQGTIGFDTPIGDIQAWPNPRWHVMTPRQLSSHTAGFPGYSENTDWLGMWHTLTVWKQYDDIEASLEIFDDADLLFEPGTGFHYSSFDVTLNGAVLQAVSGTPYLDLMAREVFDPLGMDATGGADVRGAEDGNLAVFYERADGRVKPWRRVNLSQRWAGGGLVSTSTDLVRLARGYFDPAYLRPETVATLWTPQRLADGMVNEQSYAIGWRVDETDSVLARPLRRAHHGGVSKGAMSWLVIYPEVRLATAININARADTFQDFAGHEAALSRLFIERLPARQTP